MSEHELKQCGCGCNEYRPVKATDSNLSDFPGVLSTTTTTLLDLTYEDDDGPSDDHEYISIKATEFAELLKIARECNCQPDGSSDEMHST